MPRLRKVRSDRNHIIYLLRNIHTGGTYIGVSAMIGQAKKKTLDERFRRHLSRAIHEGKGWELHKALRRYPDRGDWHKCILEVIRGRKNAHQRERILIQEFEADLNTF